MEDEDLARRLQNLPPELYNVILVKVFTPDTNIQKIDADYKPPKFLAISRTTRDMYAEAYYGSPDSSFVFDLRMGKPLVSWLKCLPSSHMQMLRHMKFIWAIQNVHSTTDAQAQRGGPRDSRQSSLRRNLRDFRKRRRRLLQSMSKYPKYFA